MMTFASTASSVCCCEDDAREFVILIPNTVTISTHAAKVGKNNIYIHSLPRNLDNHWHWRIYTTGATTVTAHV